MPVNAASPAQPADGLPVPQRHLAALTVALGITMTILDSGIANVALPSIAHQLHAQAADSVWVVNGYQLPLVMILLAVASLGDLIGYRRVYKVGLAVFTLASLACALSSTLPALVAARMVQGIGAAGLMGVSTALLRVIYPNHLLGRGIAINAVVVSVSAAAGPTVASAILSVGSWEWLFAINVPIGIGALLLALRVLPRSERREADFDWRSALLSAAMFGLLFTAVDGLGRNAPPLHAGAELAGALVAAVLLVRRELRQPAPLLPLDLLRIPMFRLSIGTSTASFAAQMLCFVALPFYFQDGLGLSEVSTGLLMTPWPLTLGVVAPFAGRLADRIPAGLLGGIGMGLCCAGLALLAWLPEHPTAFDISWRMMLAGGGFGLFQTPNNRAILGSAPRNRSGGASGMLATARLTGQTAGAAVVAILLHHFHTAGTHWALLVAAGCAATAAVVSSRRVGLNNEPSG